MATSRTRARTFRGTNDLFTLILDCKVTLEVLGPVPRTESTRTGPKNTPADRLLKFVSFQEVQSAKTLTVVKGP